MGDTVAIQIFVRVLFGVIVAMIASKRGRSGVAWFILGFLFACFALVLVLVLPDLQVQEERERRLSTENRRLRERLRKDRNVADQRHAETSRRLVVHDRALAVDTSEVLPDASKAAELPAAAATDSERRADWSLADWHYVENGKALGPIEFDALKRLWRSGTVGGSTLVWTEELDDWLSLSQVPDLEEGLRG